MGDLLIRNIPDDLRQGLAATAKIADQSLSDTATEAMRIGLEAMEKLGGKPKMSLLDAIRTAMGDTHGSGSDDQLFQEILENARSAPDRDVPDFK